MKLHDKTFEPYLNPSQINQAVVKVANEITNDYKDKQPLFIAILNGSFMFMSDLMKELHFDLEMSFAKFSSYDGTESTGVVSELIGINQNIKGRHVVIVEDIVDTGNTLESVLDILKDSGAESIKIATLLLKPTVFSKKYEINYVGLEIPNIFVVGYGLDYDEYGRNLKQIYKLKTTKC